LKSVSECPWKQGCKSLNQTWFDKKTCRKYGCFEDDEGLDIEEITYGKTEIMYSMVTKVLQLVKKSLYNQPKPYFFKKLL